MVELIVRIRRARLWKNQKILSPLLYADDTVIVSETSEDLQKALPIIYKFSIDFQLKFSYDRYGTTAINDNSTTSWNIDLNQIRTVEEYNYLGIIIN